jgi:hypothetical protein
VGELADGSTPSETPPWIAKFPVKALSGRTISASFLSLITVAEITKIPSDGGMHQGQRNKAKPSLDPLISAHEFKVFQDSPGLRDPASLTYLTPSRSSQSGQCRDKTSPRVLKPGFGSPITPRQRAAIPRFTENACKQMIQREKRCGRHQGCQ